jgi:hypothetical protein
MDYRLRGIIKSFFKRDPFALKLRRFLRQRLEHELNMIAEEADEIIAALIGTEFLSEHRVWRYCPERCCMVPEDAIQPGAALGSCAIPV